MSDPDWGEGCWWGGGEGADGEGREVRLRIWGEVEESVEKRDAGAER